MFEVSPELRYCATLLDSTASTVANNSVEPDTLSEPPAMALYQAILGTASKLPRFTRDDVIAELGERGTLQRVGGPDFVTSLFVFHGADPIDVVRRGLIQHAEQRVVTEASKRATALSEAGRVADALCAMDTAIATARRFSNLHKAAEFLDVGKHLEALVEELQALLRLEEAPPRAELGALSKSLGYPQPGTLVVIGGFSHAGKSFLMQHLERAYHDAQIPTLRLSLEDPNAVNRPRLAAEIAGADFSDPYPSKEKLGDLFRKLLVGVNRGTGFGGNVPRLVHTPDSRELQSILRDMRRGVEQHGAKVVFIDYAQLVRVPGAADQHEAVVESTGAFKEEAIRLGITLVLGSQLRKKQQGVKYYEPTADDLKDASELHHASEVLVLCWREAHQDPYGRETVTRLGRVQKDKLTGAYPFFQMVDGPGGVIDRVVEARRAKDGSIEAALDPRSFQ